MTQSSPVSAVLAYISEWSRIIWDATGDQTKVDRAIMLADLNGMFDPAKFAAFGHAQTPADATQRAIAAVSKVVSSRDDLGNVHFVLLSDAIITALSDTSTVGNSK